MKLQEIKQYRKNVDEEKAWALVQRYCKDALKNNDTPIVRGMRGFKDGYGVLHGAAGERESRNTTNHYTVILDAVLTPLGFPKRSASIICANWENRQHAAGYGGNLYAILPFDDVKIGVCPYEDIWDTAIQIGPRKLDIEDWNRAFRHLNITGNMSFKEMVSALEMAKRKRDEAPRKFSDEAWLDEFEPGKGEAVLRKAYSKPFKLTTTKRPIYNDGERHELWVGGKCVAISMKLYLKMMDNPPHELDPSIEGFRD